MLDPPWRPAHWPVYADSRFLKMQRVATGTGGGGGRGNDGSAACKVGRGRACSVPEAPMVGSSPPSVASVYPMLSWKRFSTSGSVSSRSRLRLGSAEYRGLGWRAGAADDILLIDGPANGLDEEQRTELRYATGGRLRTLVDAIERLDRLDAKLKPRPLWPYEPENQEINLPRASTMSPCRQLG
ncbi:hypothetical protein KCU81_g288, partial [Aureobasidium melanogenum]